MRTPGLREEQFTYLPLHLTSSDWAQGHSLFGEAELELEPKIPGQCPSFEPCCLFGAKAKVDSCWPGGFRLGNDASSVSSASPWTRCSSHLKLQGCRAVVLDVSCISDHEGTKKKNLHTQASPQIREISVSGSETQAPIVFKTP